MWGYGGDGGGGVVCVWVCELDWTAILYFAQLMLKNTNMINPIKYFLGRGGCIFTSKFVSFRNNRESLRPEWLKRRLIQNSSGRVIESLL